MIEWYRSDDGCTGLDILLFGKRIRGLDDICSNCSIFYNGSSSNEIIIRIFDSIVKLIQ